VISEDNVNDSGARLGICSRESLGRTAHQMMQLCHLQERNMKKKIQKTRQNPSKHNYTVTSFKKKTKKYVAVPSYTTVVHRLYDANRKEKFTSVEGYI
jgi:hypothetical protein